MEEVGFDFNLFLERKGKWAKSKVLRVGDEYGVHRVLGSRLV
jgi:hypothetical protein